MNYLKTFLPVFFLGIFHAQAQYTETINSNRPGSSQGGFAVGKDVLQLEIGPFMGNDKHALLNTSTDILGVNYGLRYGFFTEILELNFFGSFQDQTTTFTRGSFEEEYQVSNFRSNTLGAKFLLYDPYRNEEEVKPNLYSWRAKAPFRWKTLIPAVSVYGGINISAKENPFLYEEESPISPKAAVITQHNWGRWVLVMNFIGNKFTEDFPTYAGIATLTHAITPKFAIFGEYQTLISDIYADDIARTGAAFLIGRNFQLDFSALVNFKDTPTRWQLAAGVSYRLDMHNEDEYLEDTYEGIKIL